MSGTSSTASPPTSWASSRSKKGDIAEGFAKADVVIERSFTTRPVHQGYIEPHACLISVAPDGKTTIWSSSQGQFMVRAMTAYLTGIPQSDIRAIPAEIGGGFGGKTIVYLEPLATLLAKKSGRPGQDGDDPRGSDAGDGPDLGLEEHRQDRRHQGRQDRRRARHVLSAGRRLSGLADPRRRGLQLCALRHPARAVAGI